jgi:hypothetical protein
MYCVSSVCMSVGTSNVIRVVSPRGGNCDIQRTDETLRPPSLRIRVPEAPRPMLTAVDMWMELTLRAAPHRGWRVGWRHGVGSLGSRQFINSLKNVQLRS